jgi:hypothetical protein
MHQEKYWQRKIEKVEQFFEIVLKRLCNFRNFTHYEIYLCERANKIKDPSENIMS